MRGNSGQDMAIRDNARQDKVNRGNSGQLEAIQGKTRRNRAIRGTNKEAADIEWRRVELPDDFIFIFYLLLAVCFFFNE